MVLRVGLPDSSDEILTYAKEVSNLKSRLVKPMPLLVHCSAGIGRTGVFLMLELGLYMMQHEKDVNVPALLTKLREQRLNLIQTEVSPCRCQRRPFAHCACVQAQYKFVCATLMAVNKSGGPSFKLSP